MSNPRWKGRELETQLFARFKKSEIFLIHDQRIKIILCSLAPAATELLFALDTMTSAAPVVWSMVFLSVQVRRHERRRLLNL